MENTKQSEYTIWNKEDIFILCSQILTSKLADKLKQVKGNEEVAQLANDFLKNNNEAFEILGNKNLGVAIEVTGGAKFECSISNLPVVFNIYEKNKAKDPSAPPFLWWPVCYETFADFAKQYNNVAGAFVSYKERAA